MGHLPATLAHLGSLGFGGQRGGFAGVERFDLLIGKLYQTAIGTLVER